MRRWEESRGDRFSSWGAATYYFEVGPDGWPIRQIEVYDNGPILRYGPDHQEDEYGRLAQTQLEEMEDENQWAIAAQDFEDAWSPNQ
jgi:hypothetical protein